jgi:hypothetical protein
VRARRSKVLVLKTRRENIDKVIECSKHAAHSCARAQVGDYVLIAQTKNSLRRGEKSIRYMAVFDGCYEDERGESEATWGRHWTYIIRLRNVKGVRPFNVEDLQVSDRNYGPIMVPFALHESDEDAILKWINR